MKSVIRTVTKAATALALTALLGGCQTTSQKFDQQRDVDISETRIVLPAELYEEEGFEVKGAKILETGSFRREVVLYPGGHFRYSRYFLGGFKKMTKEGLLKKMKPYFPDMVINGDVKTGNFAIGKVFYVTFTFPFKDKTLSCFAMSGDYGSFVHLPVGTGTSGVTYADYCEADTGRNLEEEIMPFMKKITLR